MYNRLAGYKNTCSVFGWNVKDLISIILAYHFKNRHCKHFVLTCNTETVKSVYFHLPGSYNVLSETFSCVWRTWTSIERVPALLHSFILILAFPMRRVAEAAAPGRLEIPHSFQLSQIILLAPRQDRSKQGRGCNHATWSFVDSGPLSCRCSQQGFPHQTFLGHYG